MTSNANSQPKTGFGFGILDLNEVNHDSNSVVHVACQTLLDKSNWPDVHAIFNMNHFKAERCRQLYAVHLFQFHISYATCQTTRSRARRFYITQIRQNKPPFQFVLKPHISLSSVDPPLTRRGNSSPICLTLAQPVRCPSLSVRPPCIISACIRPVRICCLSILIFQSIEGFSFLFPYSQLRYLDENDGSMAEVSRVSHNALTAYDWNAKSIYLCVEEIRETALIR